MTEITGVDPSVETEEDPAKVSVRRLTDAEFAEIKELYELGTAGMTDLADTYKISRQALSRRFKDAGITKGSRAHEAAAAVKTAAAAVSAPAVAVIERYIDKRPEWIEETKMQGYQLLRQTRMVSSKIIADAIKGGHKLETVDAELKALGRHSKILIDNIAASIELLGGDEFVDEKDLPVLSVHDLTDNEILDHFVDIGALPENATLADLLDDNLLDDDEDEEDEEAVAS